MSAKRTRLSGAVLVFAAACGLCALRAAAQTPSQDARPASTREPADAAIRPAGTGDDWVDARLPDIDVYAQRYRAAFVDELARYHGTPRAFSERLLDRHAWPAGEVYYACALAAVAGRPCSDVVARRAVARDADWRIVAEQLGIAPGSPQAARLKRGIVASYARWGRPLPLDAELAREARRARAAAARAAATKPKPRKPAR